MQNATVSLEVEQIEWLRRQPDGISGTLRELIAMRQASDAKPPDVGAILAAEGSEAQADACWHANWNSERGRAIIAQMKFERKGIFHFLTPYTADKIEFKKRWESE